MKTPSLYLSAFVFLLASCDDSQLQALQRQKMEAESKATQLQGELDRVREQLKEANPEALKSQVAALEEQVKQAQKTAAAAEVAPKTLTEAQLDDTWTQAFKAAQFASLFGGKSPSVTLDSIVIPNPEEMYSRKVTLSSGGVSMPFVATADAAGKWKVPTPEVVAATKQSAPPQPAPPATPPAGGPVASGTNPPQQQPRPATTPPASNPQLAPKAPGSLSGAKLQEF